MIVRAVRKTNVKLTSALCLPPIRRKFYAWRSLAPEVVQPPFNLRLTESTALTTSPGRKRFMQPDPDLSNKTQRCHHSNIDRCILILLFVSLLTERVQHLLHFSKFIWTEKHGSEVVEIVYAKKFSSTNQVGGLSRAPALLHVVPPK